MAGIRRIGRTVWGTGGCEGESNSIDRNEVVNIIRAINQGKSPGHDKITSVMPKCLGKQRTKILTKIFNMAIGEVPNNGKWV